MNLWDQLTIKGIQQDYGQPLKLKVARAPQEPRIVPNFQWKKHLRRQKMRKINQQCNPRPTKPDTEKQINMRELLENKRKDHSFSNAEVQKAIVNSKSKDLGPDKLAPIPPGPSGVDCFTFLINFSIKSAVIPQNWKVGKIIPLSKPRKDPPQTKN